MPTEEKATRKLRAILYADVKGYSLLMSDDEAFTVKTLKSYRALMSELIEKHTGRVVDAPGDNLLAEGGGIGISGTVYDSIKNKLSMRNESIGEHSVFNQDIRETRYRSTIQGMKKRRQL